VVLVSITPGGMQASKKFMWVPMAIPMDFWCQTLADTMTESTKRAKRWNLQQLSGLWHLQP
jgi:hypothetical protein